MLTALALALSDPAASPFSNSDFWPAISALSELGLLIVAGFGLRQLKLAKDGLKQNSEFAKTAAKRESYKLAMEQCARFPETLSKVAALYEAVEKSGVLGILAQSKIEIVDGKVKVNPIPTPQEMMQRLTPDPFPKPTIEGLNAIEIFAAPFVAGVAAEEAAFPVVGPTFCNLLKTYAPLLVSIDACNSAMKLFATWQGRIDRSQLLMQQEALSSKLANSRDSKITTIGE